MSEEDLEFEQPPERTFEPLKPSSTHTEYVDQRLVPLDAEATADGDLEYEEEGEEYEEAEQLGDYYEEEEGNDLAFHDQGAERVFEPLNPSTTQTEYVEQQDSTPLVVPDDASGEGEIDLTISEIKGKLRSLRSRNQILRVERTSMAGRKYALETVVESLREKLEFIAELCEALPDAPGELGDALREIRDVIGDARRVAESKVVLASDLDEVRAHHLQERQQYQQQVFEANQELTGLRSEVNELRAVVSKMDRDRMQTEARLEDAEDNARAAEQLESYLQKINELEAGIEEAVNHAEQATRERDDLVAQFGPLQQDVAEKTLLIEEQRKALIELKPILEDWTRLDKECQRLARLVGEARDRGRVNVQELMARAALLKRLEKLTQEPS